MTDVVRAACLWDDLDPTSETSDEFHTSAGSSDPGDVSADVVIVGAGFTGLWTAHYLNQLDPSSRIVVLESRRVGFGASGRNGGWSSALLPMSLAALVRDHGREAALAFDRAMNASVDEICARARGMGLGRQIAKGGYVQVARTRPQWDRLRDAVTEARSFGITEDDLRVLDAEQTSTLIDVTNTLGSVFTPHCAAIQPGSLVRALAADLRARGVRILEGVTVLSIEPGRIVTDRGPMNAPVSVRATEAFTVRLRHHHRNVLPLYSLMIATEPISGDLLDSLISASRPTFNDARHLIVYGQRTADDRIAFGGRGAPYHFGSRIDPRFDTHDGMVRHLTTALREMFPALSDVSFTHHWGGPLGAHRDWNCSVLFDPRTGMASAGGYVGDGVTTSNLAGRTLAHLITGRETDLTRLPWVGHQSRTWEPEPVRWLAVNAMAKLAALADERERTTGRRARTIERILDLVLGH
jgi:glycine/D-amino acid oxidase-like deaminating enzyme